MLLQLVVSLSFAYLLLVCCFWLFFRVVQILKYLVTFFDLFKFIWFAVFLILLLSNFGSKHFTCDFRLHSFYVLCNFLFFVDFVNRVVISDSNVNILQSDVRNFKCHRLCGAFWNAQIREVSRIFFRKLALRSLDSNLSDEPIEAQWRA